MTMRACFIECCPQESRGSMGAHYILAAARAAGFEIDELDYEDGTLGYDVELCSVHHCTDWPWLADAPRRAPVRLVGGHVMANNPRPGLRYGDAFCVGEGESWIAAALQALADGGAAKDLTRLPGTLVPALWDGRRIAPNEERPLPRHAPYLNRSAQRHARTWYLELARGCPFACQYCELGWSVRYRPQDTGYLLSALEQIDRGQSSHVSLFAPDEASHRGYPQILQKIHDLGLVTQFGSMRLDQIMRRQDLPFKRNMLIRVGLDGLTEESRKRVGRDLRDDDVVEYMRWMADRGHVSFKFFMIFGFPWEAYRDFEAWELLMDRILTLPRKQSAKLRIKFTPFIPQPSTPLSDAEPIYDERMVERILGWFHRKLRPRSVPGWYVESEGLMSARSHAEQILLTRGDEGVIDEWRGLGYRRLVRPEKSWRPKSRDGLRKYRHRP
ncbi:MAG: hypothetical protein A2Y78_04760 [Acidobacteria bacterium RBG_13_68_16]|nr:MAG: hypothetical protein A2Y78_04760 [Acidobacteria bacterium RBG_13_68_16]